MFNFDTWQEIFYTIRKNKLRTFLTALSVSWGVFMLLFLLGAGSGLRHGIEHDFRDDAVNSLWLFPGKRTMPFKGMKTGTRVQLTNDDVTAIKAQIPGVEFITARYYVWGEFTVRHKDKYSSFNIRACHPDHQHLENTIMNDGRFLNKLDLEDRRKVAVIGSKVVEVLYDKDEDPIGSWIDVKGVKYMVVGTYEDDGGENEMRTIYIPITTGQVAYGGGKNVHQIMLTVGNASVEESQEIKKKVLALLSGKHLFDPKDDEALYVRNMVQRFQRFQNLFTTIDTILFVVGIMTIIAGIVGVSNIMLIVVKERTKEIGIRKAIGASPASIIGLFLQESIAITLASGYFGLLSGVAIVEAAAWALTKFSVDAPFFRNPQVDMNTAIAATLILVFAGALAGYIPARKAASVNPIEALHDE
ncbi:MAG: ABC transporter permease [Cytophagales bacterium]|nr:ABC transporter permease [Cytophagales bacterium]